MKKATLILAALALGLHFQAAAQQPDAVYRLLRHEWTLNPDGTSDYRYRHEVQILRNRALTAYADKGETFVVYNPDIEEVTVNEVYTIQLDGSRVDMPQNAFIHQLPAECADCARFNHLRELAMVHTGMEIGCLVVVDYTVHRRHNFLHETLPLLVDSPVETLEIKVNAPADMEVRQALLGEEYLPAGVAKSDLMRRSITLRNLPQAPREPYMPEHIVPKLRLFNAPIGFSPAITAENFRGAEDAMGQVMLGDDRAKVIAARDFVLRNIHLNDIHPRHLGYTRAIPAEVWRSRCGTATDKAVLLAAILRHEGYTAHVIGDHMDRVAVLIDTLEYSLDIRRSTPPQLIGEARDILYTATVDHEDTARLDTLEGGFFRLKINDVHTPLPDVATLPLQRTTPLATSACDLRHTQTYILPKKVKMTTPDLQRTLNHTGLGSVEVSIRQNGRKLLVTRIVKTEKSTIAPADYPRFRQLMAAWQHLGDLIFRAQ